LAVALPFARSTDVEQAYVSAETTQGDLMISVTRDRSRAALLRLALVLLTATPSLSARAALTVSTFADAVPAGVHYVNFDDVRPDHLASGGLSITFTPNSWINMGAAPYLSNRNGVPFGDSTFFGANTTLFLFAGTPITLALPSPQRYFGILWGSVDPTNSLSFYAQDGTLVGTVMGSDVTANANGSWGDGTLYVNVTSSLAFTTVFANGGDSIFEFDNVAYNASVPAVSSVPEPSTAAMALVGLLATLGFARKLRAN
jgi:hypothetical protein